MASEKISQLPLATSSSGSDLYPLVSGGVNYAITFTNLQTSIASALIPSQLPTITLTGNVTGSAAGGTISTTISNSVVTNAMLVNVANNTVKGNKSGVSAAPTDLSLGNVTETVSSVLTISGGSAAVVGSGLTIQVKQATGSQDGYLSSTDWTTFNNKQAALTFGNLTDAGTDGITVTGGTGAVIGSGTSISQHVADSSHNGYLSSTDWTTFNNKQPAGNYITALTGDVSASGPGSVAATVNSVGGSSASNIHSAELLANAATSSDVASAIVKRDASGNFNASTITANLTGNATNITASSNATLTTLSALTTASSLSSVGTITSGVWNGTAIGTTYGGLGGNFGSSTGALSISSGTVSAGTLSVANGGTGQTSALTQYGVVYASSTTAMATTAAGTSGYILTSNATSAPTYQQLNLGTSAAITGTLQAAQFPALTGDITTTASSLATTLATVNSNVGTFGSSSSIPTFTVNAKGLITAASGNAVTIPTPGTPVSQTPNQSNDSGSSANYARADHVHNIPTATASSLTTASTNTQGSAASFAQSDHTHEVTVSNQNVTAASGTTTTATSDTLITGMTITPTSGTYLVLFTSSVVNSANGSQQTFASVYFNGSKISNSEIAIGTSGGVYSPVTVQGIVAANGTNAIEIRARTLATRTSTWYQMTMQLIRLSN